MSGGARKAALTVVPGSPLPYAIDAAGVIVTTGNFNAGEEYFCPACREPAVFDKSLGRIGQLRHTRRRPCPFDNPSVRLNYAVQRMRRYLESLASGHEAWPWVTRVCECRLEGLRDLRGQFFGFRLGDVAAGEPDFYLLDGGGRIVLSLFIRDRGQSLAAVHQSYDHRFIVIDPERALRVPSVWRLETIDGWANYRKVVLPPCPVCVIAVSADKKTAQQ